ncbi:MAG: nitrophenyl compound nitroreductase subunit ArsF family protein [Candidatus Sumerlaeia bacterium]
MDKMKKIITICLLLFAGASVAVFAMREMGVIGADASEEKTDQDATASKADITVYYFNTSKRCDTCKKLENYAKAALDKHYADEMASGKIDWRKVNFEKEENTDLAMRYDLVFNTVVIQDNRKSGEDSWVSLPEIWDLVKDKEQYMDFIHEKMMPFMEKAKT